MVCSETATADSYAILRKVFVLTYVLVGAAGVALLFRLTTNWEEF